MIGWTLIHDSLTALLPSLVKNAKCQLTRVKRCRSKPPSFLPGRPTCHGVFLPTYSPKSGVPRVRGTSWLGIGVRYWDLLGKRVQRCRSLPSVALRSFLNDPQVSENDPSCCCAHAQLLSVESHGRRARRWSFLCEKTILGKYVTCKLYWLIFTNYKVKDF